MTTAIATPDLAREISEEVERRKKDLTTSIECYRGYIARKEQQLTEVEGKVIEMFEVKAQLEAAGFQARIESWTDSLKVSIEKDQLTAIYGVVGRFDGKNAIKDIENSSKRLVRVTLTPVKYPFVSVSYITKLPKRGAKCRIETVKVKARTEKRLICET
jgi:hypothetical protein